MTITRLTGTLDAWIRLNKPFVAAVRRQFLHWRAVDEEQKATLFETARMLLEGGKVDDHGKKPDERSNARKE